MVMRKVRRTSGYNYANGPTSFDFYTKRCYAAGTQFTTWKPREAQGIHGALFILDDDDQTQIFIEFLNLPDCVIISSRTIT